ncbi:MAG: alkaline phosphatase family protein [Candidatus Binatia bacterium]
MVGALSLAGILGLSACGPSPAPTDGQASAKPATKTVPAAAGTTAPAAAPPRLVVLGLDAGDWSLLGPWMDKGLLPNLARLRADGVHGKLRSTEPSSSPVIWTSIATGKTPAKTGIDWFVRFPHGPGKPVPVDRRQLKTRTLWNIFSKQRIDVAVLGWYVTWPAEEVNGRLLTDLAHFGGAAADSFPESFLWDLKPVPERAAIAAMPRFLDFAYDPAKASRPKPDASGKTPPPTLDFLVFDRFLRAWARDSYYLEAARRTLADGPLPEAFFLYLRGTDDVQHGFWKFMDPQSFRPRETGDGKPLAGATEVPPEQVAAFGKVIERYWQWMDEEVGKILARYAGTPTLVVVCSDHGAGPAVGEHEVAVPEYLHLSGAHRIDGIFLASGPGIRRGAEVSGATIYDVAPTLLHALGLPVGKDMDGRVLGEIFEGPTAERQVAFLDSHDGADPAAAAAETGKAPADVDEKVLEHLRSLGYIGD